MHYFVIDENEKNGYDEGKYRVYKRHFWHDTERLIASCRLLGHKAERVDLTYHGHYYQCKRCGSRPEPQTAPNGNWQKPKGGAHLEWWVLPKKLHDSWSLNFKVGHPGSENNFAGHVTTPVAAVYWGLEGYGQRFVRLLNNDRENYESREFGLAYHDGKFWVKIWAKRNSWSSTDPKWQQMNWSPADSLFGRWKNAHEVVETQSILIPMPEGSYPAIANLERWERWREKRPNKKSISYSYDVKINEPARFIPVPGKGENSWDCDDDGNWGQSGPVKFKGSWVTEAIGEMVKSALRDRERYASRDWVPSAGWSEGLVKS